MDRKSSLGKPLFKHSIFHLLWIVLLGSSCTFRPAGDYIDLAGIWQFRIDSLDRGISDQWYMEDFGDEFLLPGSMNGNGKGNEPSLFTPWTGSIYDSSWFYNPALVNYRTEKPLKFPFWLTPEKHYTGPAWYRNCIDIPGDWEGSQISLILERPHWETTVWIDSIQISNQNSLSTPHFLDLGGTMPGKHTITIRVDNRLDEVNVGPDSHSVTDHTQGNWNGIIGQIRLISKPVIHISDMQLFPDIHGKIVRVVMVIENSGNYTGSANVKLSASSLPPAKRHRVPAVKTTCQLSGNTDTVMFELKMGDDILLWDEFEPNLYNFRAELEADGLKDRKDEQFGMREINVKGKQILVNDRPVFMRGNVDCCVFPLTGYPPMDVDSWEKVFRKLKDFGLNHVRFHSWCPPEAAFTAADRVGVYLQPEGPSWANHGTSLGNGRPIDKYIYEETERIVAEYGNHPSFCMFAYGNEPRGNYVAFLDKWVNYWKLKDSRRIYTGASIGGSWKECKTNQYHVKGGARGLPWRRLPNSTFNYERNIARFEVPFITHELGQYCVFPDFSEIDMYTGSYKAYNFELFRDLLEKNHMGDQARDFLLASGELQKICYKYEMEASLRTSGMAGYQLLGLNDFPGQGTALVGVLNAFYEEKEYVTPEYFRQFCGPVTLLATLPKFVYNSGEEFAAGLELANYGMEEINEETVYWRILNSRLEVVNSGDLASGRIPVGKVIELGEVNFQDRELKEAQKFTLEARLGEISNSWDFWIFPEQLPEQENSIHVTDTIDNSVLEILASGGKVLLLAAGNVENGKDVIQYFTPVFWNTSWFKMRPPHTTGILIQDSHPVFRDFPTEFHSNLQWWELLNNQQVMNLENFPHEFRPLVQPIDTWFISRRLGLLWEANSGGGKIMVCSADLQNNLKDRPAARQLLFSIKNYMNSPEFNPGVNVETKIIQELFEKKDRQIINLYTKNSPDELKPGK